jgi:AraC-like DNA-binding protein
MIQTITCSPSGILMEYISYYAVREFGTHESIMLKPMPAKHEIHMMFMINSKMHYFENNPNNLPFYVVNEATGPDCVFSGLLTFNMGSIVFKGPIKLLTIHFKPAGFYWLFGISPAEITNCLGACCDLFSSHVIRLHEQLHEAKTSTEMFGFTDKYLLEQLQNQKTKKRDRTMLALSGFLTLNPINISIEKLANETNMCLKTFERKFIEEVGLSPRLFERIRRFNKALDIKMSDPAIRWTNICFQTGYYDQNHFIKDFTEFAGQSPGKFFKDSPPPTENISSILK